MAALRTSEKELKAIAADLEGMKRLEFGAFWRTLMREHIAMKAMCLYLLIEYVRPQDIFEPLHGIPVALMTLILAAAVMSSDRERSPQATPLDGLVIAFTIVVMLSAVFAYSPAKAFENITLPISWLLIYMLMTRVVTLERRWMLAIFLFLLFTFKMAQHAVRSWAERGFAFEDWGVAGAPGWFSNSGELGIQMTIFLPLALVFYLAYRQHWGRLKRGFMMLFPLFAALTILASSSRGAVVGGAAGLIWLVVRLSGRWKSLVMLAVVGFLAMQLMPDEFMARFETAGGDKTSMSRLERWHAGMDTMKHHPLLGIGYDNWAYYYPRNYTLQWGGSLLVHNMFVQASAELGLTGLLLLIALLLASFVTNARTRKRAQAAGRDDLVKFAHGLDAACIGMIISGFFVTVLFYPFLWIHFALVSCLYAVAFNVAKQAAATAANAPPSGHAALESDQPRHHRLRKFRNQPP